MTLKTRRLIYLSFIFLYLIITPFILLYTAGYKINFAEKKIIKTGAFILATDPAGSEIKIDGKIQKNSWQGFFSGKRRPLVTPAKIKNLLPGEYSVEISPPGFWPWRKNLSINPGNATFAEHILLFKKSSPNLLIDNDFFDEKFSKTKNQLLLFSTDQTLNLNLNNRKIEIMKFASSSEAEKSEIKLSANGQYLLLKSEIYNTTSGYKIYDLNNFGLASSTMLSWHADDSLKLYGLTDEKLICLNLDNQSTTTLTEKIKPLELLAKKNYFYLLKNQKNKTTLNKYRSDPWKIQKSIELPPSNGYAFINTDNELINILDKNYQVLYLIEPESMEIIAKDFGKVKLTTWLENYLLYANDFEIWLYDKTENKKTLITRISQPITHLIWHPNKNHFFYSTKQTINAIELDERDRRNATQLATVESLSGFYANEKGTTLYFIGQYGETKGVYELSLL